LGDGWTQVGTTHVSRMWGEGDHINEVGVKPSIQERGNKGLNALYLGGQGERKKKVKGCVKKKHACYLRG